MRLPLAARLRAGVGISRPLSGPDAPTLLAMSASPQGQGAPGVLGSPRQATAPSQQARILGDKAISYPGKPSAGPAVGTQAGGRDVAGSSNSSADSRECPQAAGHEKQR